MSAATAHSVTWLLDRLGQSGTVGREFAVRADLVRSTGIGYALKRLRDHAAERQLSASGGDGYLRIWRDAARQLGADVTELTGGFLDIRIDDVYTRVCRNLVMLDDAVTLRFALEKRLVNDLLTSAGLPVPDGLEFDASDLSSAMSFLAAGTGPVVVKPVTGGGGWAVTSEIHTESDLRRARLRASRVDRRLMIERQARGDCYRFLVLDGKLLDVIRRRPPRVTGDGQSTIAQLIAAENRQRVARRNDALLWLLTVDLDCIFTLRKDRLTLKSVLPAGVTIPVKTVINQNTIKDNETVGNGVSEELLDEVRAAVELVGLRLAGVDVITTDLDRPLRSTGGVILELNGTPGLNYHYEVADAANATPVAVPILRALVEAARSRASTAV